MKLTNLPWQNCTHKDYNFYIEYNSYLILLKTPTDKIPTNLLASDYQQGKNNIITVIHKLDYELNLEKNRIITVKAHNFFNESPDPFTPNPNWIPQPTWIGLDPNKQPPNIHANIGGLPKPMRHIASNFIITDHRAPSNSIETKDLISTLSYITLLLSQDLFQAPTKHE